MNLMKAMGTGQDPLDGPRTQREIAADTPGALCRYITRQSLDLKTEEQVYGFRLFGPILGNFLHRVCERCRELGVNRIYFVAREGYILKRLYHLLAPLVWLNGGEPQAEYLYLSRLTTFLSASPAIGLRELAIIERTLVRTEPTLRRLTAPFLLDEDLLRRVSSRHGCADLDEPLPVDWKALAPLHHFLRDSEITSGIRRASKEMRSHLEAYLTEAGFFLPGRAAFVDVGWRGQIQSNLDEAFRERADFPRLHGLYMGLFEEAHLRASVRSTSEAVLCDERENLWHGNTALDFVEIFENALRAPHGTTMGYHHKDQCMQPVLLADDEPSRVRERQGDPFLTLVQSGVLEYSRYYRAACAESGWSAWQLTPYARSILARLVAFPVRQEVRWIFALNHGESFGNTSTISLGSGLRGLNAMLHPLEFLRSFRRAPWRNGILLFVPLPGIMLLRTVYMTCRAAFRRASAVYSRQSAFLDQPAEERAAYDRSPHPWEEMMWQSWDTNWEETLAHARKGDASRRFSKPVFPIRLRQALAMCTSWGLSNLCCRLNRQPGFPQDGVSSRWLLKWALLRRSFVIRTAGRE